LVAHRLKREQKVVDSLQQLGESNLDELVVVVYDDVDTERHEMAKLSMTAHLIKLQQEGRARELDGGRWGLES
jgi:hypothetical protein